MGAVLVLLIVALLMSTISPLVLTEVPDLVEMYGKSILLIVNILFCTDCVGVEYIPSSLIFSIVPAIIRL